MLIYEFMAIVLPLLDLFQSLVAVAGRSGGLCLLGCGRVLLKFGLISFVWFYAIID